VTVNQDRMDEYEGNPQVRFRLGGTAMTRLEAYAERMGLSISVAAKFLIIQALAKQEVRSGTED